METGDAFADHMDVCRPPCFVRFLIPAEADAALINVKCVEPHIDSLSGIIGHRHAPVFCPLVGTRYAYIGKPSFKKCKNLIFSFLRNNPERIVFNKSDKLFLIF